MTNPIPGADSELLPLPQAKHQFEVYHDDGRVTFVPGYTAEEVEEIRRADRAAAKVGANVEACSRCGKALNNPADLTSMNCGGDCLSCMAECGDPEAMSAIARLAAGAPAETPKPVYLVRYTSIEGWRVASEEAYWTFSECNRRILYEAAQPSPAPIAGPMDANELERLAIERPDECFLKGSGVLKLIGAIRTLEKRISEGADVEKDAQDVPQQFLDYVTANYNGVIDIHRPEWHAKRLWNAAMKARAAHPSPAPIAPKPVQEVSAYWMRQVKVWLPEDSAEQKYGDWELIRKEGGDNEKWNMDHGKGYLPGQLEFRPLYEAAQPAPIAGDVEKDAALLDFCAEHSLHVQTCYAEGSSVPVYEVCIVHGPIEDDSLQCMGAGATLREAIEAARAAMLSNSSSGEAG